MSKNQLLLDCLKFHLKSFACFSFLYTCVLLLPIPFDILLKDYFIIMKALKQNFNWRTLKEDFGILKFFIENLKSLKTTHLSTFPMYEI